MADEAANSSQIRYISGRTEIGRFRENMKIKSLFQEDGMSKFVCIFFCLTIICIILVNFDIVEEILQASLVRNLHLNVKETPLLFTEASIHNKDLRLKLTEYLFERL